jgi:hypothetical protein
MKGTSLDISKMESHIIFSEDKDNRQHVYMQSMIALDNKKEFEFITKHSKHSRKRASQRSFDYNILLNVLILGTPFFKQGMTFYTVMENDIPEGLNHKVAEKMRNLIVVTGRNDHQIITCYYSKNAVKHLRRKGKELKK